MTERAGKGDGPSAEFTLGEWLVQPTLNRIKRGENAVRLRPQLMNLLVCLADRAGQVVSREEILAIVWQGQFIADSGLARCVAELRSALGDAAGQDSRYIETISKRGYRLVAAVTFAPDAATETVAPAEAGAGVATGDVPEASDRAADAVRPEVLARSTSSGATDKRRALRRSHVVATVGLGVLVFVVYVLWPRSVAQTLTTRDTVVLAFDNTTGEPVFDGALRLALAVQLEQSPFLRLLPESRLREQLRFMGRPPDQAVGRALALEVCQREGARAVLAGSLSKLGREYVVGFEAVACQSGDTFARQQAQAAGKEDILGAVGGAARRLRQELGESLASVQRFDVPLAQATTASLEALKAFSQAEEARQMDYPQAERAVPLYRQAIDLDPQFALAYARLGALLRQGLQRQQGVEMFRKAYDLRDRVSEAERYDIVTEYYTSVTGERAKAHETYLLWRSAYPRSWQAWYGLASEQLQEGRFREAIDGCERAMPLSPNPALPAFCVVRGYMGLSEFDAAEAVVQEAFKRKIDSRAMHVIHWLNALARNDRAAMDAEIQWSLRSAEMQLELLRGQAWAAMSLGRREEARARLREAMALAHNVADGVARVHIDEAYLEALAGDPRIATAAARRALEATGNADLRAMAAMALAAAGDRTTAGAVIRDAAPGPDDLFQRIVFDVAGAEMELLRGQPLQALARLEPVRPFELGIYAQLIPIGVRAEAHLRAGQAQEAIEAYQSIIAHRGVHPAAPQGPLAYLGLGRACALAGRDAEARAAYDQFFAIWKDADADLPLLHRARAEYARLR